MADSTEVSCEIPTQCEFIGKYENHDMVKHILKEDVKLFNFITTFAQKISEGNMPHILTNGNMPYIINNGVIIRFPSVYFYFIKYTYLSRTGKQSIKIGFICWARGIYATIDIDFHVYPRKSVYVDADKAWCLPFSEATRRVKIFNPTSEHAYQNAATYVYAFSDALMSVIRLCVQYDVTEIRQACFTHRLSSYTSYRLTDLLVYHQKLVSKVRAFMILHCSCSFKTTVNIPYCGCETLCSETIPKQFVDVARICGDVLFCDTV
jgi:hypothetical protein